MELNNLLIVWDRCRQYREKKGLKEIELGLQNGWDMNKRGKKRMQNSRDSTNEAKIHCELYYMRGDSSEVGLGERPILWDINS